MNILGVSFDYHDAAAALICDGRIIAAVQEERFSRRKNDASLPTQAIDFCLEAGALRPGDIDHVVFYEDPILKLDRIVRSAWEFRRSSRSYMSATLNAWIDKQKYAVVSRLSGRLGLGRRHIHCVGHHESHAGVAFYCSPFSEATVVTVDGVGEYETLSISHGQGQQIHRLVSARLPNSLGLFYSAFTAFLGFRVNEDEYKVMGMAGFGKPVLHDEMLELFQLHDDGTFTLDQKFFNFLCPEDVPYTKSMVDWLGSPREPESPFDIQSGGNFPGDAASCQKYADIAASVQSCTETVMLHIAQKAVQRTGCKRLCLAGGVALNGLANGRIKRDLGCEVYVHPAAGDAGGSLGSALFYYHSVLGLPRQGPMEHAYWGRQNSDAEIQSALSDTNTTAYRIITNPELLIDEVSDLLCKGCVVGWVQGRFEWGPRALGSRSILANPMIADMQAIVNEKIKFREPFRPFAPAVLEERTAEFFDVGDVMPLTGPEYYMLSIGRVREEWKTVLPAVTHVDGTARVQMVSRKTNHLYYDLIKVFGEKTGVPVLLNTSFNLRGEPIVNTPLDALKTFEWSDMDYLVMGNVLIAKEM